MPIINKFQIRLDKVVCLPTALADQIGIYSQCELFFDPSWDDKRYQVLVSALFDDGEKLTQKQFHFISGFMKCQGD